MFTVPMPSCLANNRDYNEYAGQRPMPESAPLGKNAPQPEELEDFEDNIFDFLDILWPETPDGWNVLCTLRPPKHHYIDPNELENSRIIATRLDQQGLDVYHALGFQPEAARDAGSRRAEDVLAIPGLWCDIDVAGPNHKQTNLPRTMDEALEFIHSLPWQPSIVVNSGGGVHAYWLFTTPWQFDDESDRQKAEVLSKKFGEYLIAEGLKRGWKIDNVSDLARILRLPGTHNHKSNPPKQVTMLERHPERRYAVAEFEWLKNFTPPAEHRVQSGAKSYGPIPSGERNNTLASIGGGLRAQGYDQAAIEAELLKANQARCQPPLPDGDVRSIAASISRYPQGPATPRPVTKGLPLTDTGNAARLAQQFADAIRFCGKWKKWMVWNGSRWEEDAHGQIVEYAKQTARSIYAEAQVEPDAEKSRKIAQHGIKSQSRQCIKAMVELAQSEPGIPVLPSQFDQDNMLFNCSGGVIDLQSGELVQHAPQYLISKIAPVEHAPEASCPQWLKFLDRVMDGNLELIEFLQKAVGYSLTGDITEQVFFLLYGTGANGKSVFLEVLRRLVGEYGMQTDFTTFLKREGEGVRNDLARLKGARFVTASEMESGRQLSEVVIKQVTGGEPISARFLFGEYFDFTPTFKVFLATNHKPQIKNQDNGIWRRVRLIPFTVTIPESERDPKLVEKLGQELPGILNWALEGCRKWLAEGLGCPDDIREATEDYKADMDVLGDFLSECCDIGPGYQASLGEIFNAYEEWCKGRSVVQLGKQIFNDMLSVRAGISKVKTNGVRKWKGIQLKPVEDAF